MTNGATYVAQYAKLFEAPEISTQELETAHLHKLSGRNSTSVCWNYTNTSRNNPQTPSLTADSRQHHYSIRCLLNCKQRHYSRPTGFQMLLVGELHYSIFVQRNCMESGWDSNSSACDCWWPVNRSIHWRIRMSSDVSHCCSTCLSSRSSSGYHNKS